MLMIGERLRTIRESKNLSQGDIELGRKFTKLKEQNKNLIRLLVAKLARAIS